VIENQAERLTASRLTFCGFRTSTIMNISREEQRVLHVLAQGGLIRFTRAASGKLTEVDCFTREGSLLVGCTLGIVSGLRRKRLIESRNSSPYRISALGRRAVRAQPDNRTS